ncbi:MAG: hypothetical protein VX738_03815 [Planctomycetota bacterium]|nr:hypothetical protein [Planctomycetota bacterium]
MHWLSLLLLCLTTPWVAADFPAPRLDRLFPPGGMPGSSFEIEVTGSELENLTELYSPHPGITFTRDAQGQFTAHLARDVPPGRYTVQCLGPKGLSSSRLLLVNELPVLNEQDVQESKAEITEVKFPVAVQGVIGAKGDIDIYRFEAEAGQVVILECWAERLDSSLRAVLQVVDDHGKRLASNSGFFGTDAFLPVQIPETGNYEVHISDLVFAGAETAFYRLEIHDRPRVLFTLPAAVHENQSNSLQLIGYNLGSKTQSTLMQSINMDVEPDQFIRKATSLPVHAQANAIGVSFSNILAPNAIMPYAVGVTDLPVVSEIRDKATDAGNDTVHGAGVLPIPVDVTGQLSRPNDRDWYQIRLRKGEVIHVETLGERIGSPVDLSVHLFDASGEKQLATYHNSVIDVGQKRFPASHADAVGQFTATRDGLYHLVVLDRTSSSKENPRRIYRLILRRENPRVHVVAINKSRETPAGFTLRPGGNTMLHLLAFPTGGFHASVKISAVKLPPGVTCEPSWMGPGVNQVPLVFQIAENAELFLGQLQFEASYQRGGETITVPVTTGTMSRSGTPNGLGRLETELTAAVIGHSPLAATAHVDRLRYQQGSIIDLQVTVDRDADQIADSMLISGEGLPAGIQDRVQTVAADQKSGTVSFYIPPFLEPGRYSIAARVRTKMNYPANAKEGSSPPQDVELTTNAVSFEVYPAPFVVEVDLDAPRTISRGEIVQLKYSARRQNGFIGKIHTELAAPGGVQGIRGRGVTFVGQTDAGVIQIIANDDAPLGQQAGLRLEGLGTVEDEGVHLGSIFLNLEIVE